MFEPPRVPVTIVTISHGWVLPAFVLLFAALLGGACSGRGSAEQVAHACEHQLTVAKRGAIAARMRASGTDPESADGQRALTGAIAEALADPSGQASLERCRTLYAELPQERLECILGANDPVAINACTPQADRHR